MSFSPEQENQPLRVLGIDPGSRIVGFACVAPKTSRNFVPGDYQVLDAGVLRAPTKKCHAERLGMLHEALYELVLELKPTVCAVERAFTGVNSFTALRLGEARGALIAAVQRCHVPIVEIAPAQAKKIITGQGAATKEQVSLVLSTIWKFERGKLPLDATDALALALSCGLSSAVPLAIASGVQSKLTRPGF